jgi:hypothetical protein
LGELAALIGLLRGESKQSFFEKKDQKAFVSLYQVSEGVTLRGIPETAGI